MLRFKRILSMLLAIVMLVSLCPTTVFAAEEQSQSASAEPQSDGAFTYTVLDDGTLSISGYSGVPMDEASGIHLQIPDQIDGKTVTQLAEEAFAYNEDIVTILIPETVTVIGNAAFHRCEKLKAVAFSGNEPAFGFTVAEGCAALEKIFALETADISAFCALLVSDLGEDKARQVQIDEFADRDAFYV